MGETNLKNFIENHCILDQEEDGLQHYALRTVVRTRDVRNKVQVLTIGTPSERKTKCILLLGETGAGKSTIINAMINYIFGVKFDDEFRLKLIDEGNRGNRSATESQTDYITVYILYNSSGLSLDFNFVLIDTPGLADTRGAQHQERVMANLEVFLTSDYGFDELNCIGLVAKATTTRDFSFHKQIMSEIVSLLGCNVTEISLLLATFAVEKTIVDQVVRNAGVQFQDMYELDNGVVFAPHMLSSVIRKRDREMLVYRWENMLEEYERLFDAIVQLPPVSVKLFREKKLLYKSMNLLKLYVEDMGKLLSALEVNKKMLFKYEFQEAKNKNWRHEKRVKRRERLAVEEGFHAHNCSECKQTCIFPCPPEKQSNNAGMIGGVAGVLGGTAAGAAAAQVTVNTAVAAARAATTTSGFAASVGNLVTRALGGAAVGGEVGSVGGVPGLIVGGLVGVAVGAVAGNCCGRMLTNASCLLPGRGNVCGERGCLHALSDHLKEGERIMEYEDMEVKIHEDIKELYDVAVSKKADVMAHITSGRQKLLMCKRQIALNLTNMLFHVRKVEEMTHTQVEEGPQEVLDRLIAEVRLGPPDHIHHAIGVVNILKRAIDRLNTFETDQIQEHTDIVLNLLENVT